ncbi:DUF4412 domain-containing protein [bacterium]|nr:MAG: DUF4412 domain-containing protein [bacterium]
MKNLFLYLLPIFIITALSVLTAEAGIQITTVQGPYDNPESAYTSVSFIGKNGMRIETGDNGEENIIIYRNDKKVFWVINPREKTYTEMTRKDIQAMKSRMDEAMVQMQEQMKNMTPEQRAMMQQMMKGTMPVQPKEIVYRKTDSKARISRWTCNKYIGYLDGTKKKEVWTTDWKSLGLSKDHFAVMQGMSLFISEITKGVTDFFRTGSEKWEQQQGYSGVPVRTISYSNGKADIKTEIKEVKEKDFSPALFDLPTGFMKKKFGI